MSGITLSGETSGLGHATGQKTNASKYATETKTPRSVGLAKSRSGRSCVAVNFHLGMSAPPVIFQDSRECVA